MVDQQSMPTHQKLLSLIHANNPYDDFDASQYPFDNQGWGSEDTVFSTLIAKHRPQVIFEVGVWKGGSTITMANAAKAIGLKTSIISIDTWLGAREFWTEHEDPTRYLALALKNGFPSVYYQFLANIVHSDLAETVIPFPQTSLIAARFFEAADVKADLIYIDASHEADDVFMDLLQYIKVLKPGGVMFGDDYDEYWPGVRRAVDTFAAIFGLDLQIINDRFWMIQISQNILVRPMLDMLDEGRQLAKRALSGEPAPQGGNNLASGNLAATSAGDAADPSAGAPHSPSARITEYGMPALGINAAASVTDRLTVSGNSTLFSHDGDGHQVKINRASSKKAASILYETNFTAGAETGLFASTSEYQIRVTANGADWRTVLTADAQSGRITAEHGITSLHQSRAPQFSATGPAGTYRSYAMSSFDRFRFDVGVTAEAESGANRGSNFYVARFNDDGSHLGTALFIHRSTGIVELNGGVALSSANLAAPNCSMAELPSASQRGPGAIIFVNDAENGGIIAFSDGTNWLRSDNRKPLNKVSTSTKGAQPQPIRKKKIAPKQKS